MINKLDRREFLKHSACISTAATLGIGVGGGAVAAEPKKGPFDEVSEKGMPVGNIGNLKVSRLIAGGNLISGWSHSRDLIYVHDLMRHYNSDEKVMDTLEILEENGVNTIIADPSERPYRIFPKYWKERGGKIQWIAEGHPTTKDIKTDIKTSIDHGVSAIYIQGVIGDSWLKNGHIDLLGDCVELIKSNGLPGGIGAHMLDVIITSEKRKYNPDFYVKTLHHGNYWSARPKERAADVISNHHDNYWSMTPEKTKKFMEKVTKPWIAFKILAAGAIHPKDGFKFAFSGGADFICVGMFDFQVVENSIIAKKTLKSDLQRKRPWIA